MSSKDVLRQAVSFFRVEGELVEKDADGGISVRRGGSIYGISKEDILEIHESDDKDDKKVQIIVRADAELMRTSIIRSEWFGGAVGFRPIFSDCEVCVDCSDCTECIAECSICIPPPSSQPGSTSLSAFIRRVGTQGNRFLNRTRRG
jgi:hypothetical protein